MNNNTLTAITQYKDKFMELSKQLLLEANMPEDLRAELQQIVYEAIGRTAVEEALYRKTGQSRKESVQTTDGEDFKGAAVSFTDAMAENNKTTDE